MPTPELRLVLTFGFQGRKNRRGELLAAAVLASGPQPVQLLDFGLGAVWYDNHGVAWLAGFASGAFFTRRTGWACWAWHWNWHRHGDFFFNGGGRLHDGGRWRIDGGFFAGGQAGNGEHSDENSCFHDISFLEWSIGVNGRCAGITRTTRS
jgi:hypothetical protein